jgi:NAD(P)-dependent dehydrogenase (short-subunit alcohol dehydrogenase family)
MTQTHSQPQASTSISSFWHAARHPPADPTTSYAGKTILITGANTGLGFEAATKFAALGASTLIFGVRSLERGKDAKSRIEERTKCSSSVIRLFQLDMMDFGSIDKFVKEVNKQFEKIDIAVLNAGVAVSAYALSVHGWEGSLQVNVLSTAYLAILLLPRLRDTAASAGHPSLLEVVASAGHIDAKEESVSPTGSRGILAVVNDKSTFSVLKQYQISKLLTMWAVQQIAARTSPREIVLVASCPGLCRSSLGRDFGVFVRALDYLIKSPMVRSTEQGSRTLVSATTLGKDAHGGFWSNDEITEYVSKSLCLEHQADIIPL